LIDYAKANDAKPMYLLYNFAASPLRSGITLTTPSELTGCTLISAEHLLDNYYNQRTRRDGTSAWLIPHFYNLNPDYAFAWHELVCPEVASDLYNVLQNRGLASQGQIQSSSDLILINRDLKQGFYPLNTFTKNDSWVSVAELSVPKSDFEKQDRSIENRTYKVENVDGSMNEQKGYNERERVYPSFSPKSRIILSK
jgi:hypothetical protein